MRWHEIYNVFPFHFALDFCSIIYAYNVNRKNACDVRRASLLISLEYVEGFSTARKSSCVRHSFARLHVGSGLAQSHSISEAKYSTDTRKGRINTGENE